MAETVDIAQFTLAVEDLVRPFAVHANGFGEWTEQLDDLRDVIVVLAVFRS